MKNVFIINILRKEGPKKMNRFDRIIMEYSRKREEEVGKEIKESKTEDSSPISALIRSTLKNGHKVYLCTDWHLWMFDKKTKRKTRRSDFNQIINHYNDIVTDDDLVINLGDLTDGEVEKKKELGDVIGKLKGTKILVRGNNDLYDDAYYTSIGFKYVTPKFVYDNILFSHMPQENNNKMNIHGHIHGYKTYWCPYNNQIDVAAVGGRKTPIELDMVIKAQPAYSKTVKVCPEKFEQEFYFDPYPGT